MTSTPTPLPKVVTTPAVTAIEVPTYVAYFTVKVPASAVGRDNSVERAREIVERYLYQGEVVMVEQRLDIADPYRFLVRVETTGSRSDLERRLSDQRERFSSGLYATYEPVIMSQGVEG